MLAFGVVACLSRLVAGLHDGVEDAGVGLLAVGDTAMKFLQCGRQLVTIFL